MATPELVELGYLGNIAAGAAVTETGQRGADLHTCDRDGALDGFAELQKLKIINIYFIFFRSD